MPQLDDPGVKGHSAIAYNGRAKTIRTDSHRMILHRDGHVELYDHTNVAGETKNLAQSQAELIKQLTGQLQARLEK